jgi:hypothetical protein
VSAASAESTNSDPSAAKTIDGLCKPKIRRSVIKDFFVVILDKKLENKQKRINITKPLKDFEGHTFVCPSLYSIVGWSNKYYSVG